MRNYTLIIVCLVAVTSLQAQSFDSISAKPKSTAKIITNQFPTARFLDVQYEQFTKTDYETKVHRSDYESGSFDSEKRIHIAMNIPIIKKEKWVLSTSLRYRYSNMAFSNIMVPSGRTSILGGNRTSEYHYFMGSLNYTRYGQLFGKRYISNVSVLADASNEKFGMVNATYIGTFILKKDKNTTITAGLVLQTSPNSLFPILPAFTYYHQFENSLWEIEVSLPKQAYMRRPLLQNGRLSLGLVSNSESVYFEKNLLGDGNKLYNFNRIELKLEIMYEYRFTENLIGYLRTGWSNVVMGTVRERYKFDELSKITQDSNFYFNLGCSFNLLK